jgi:hypothetical protein
MVVVVNDTRPTVREYLPEQWMRGGMVGEDSLAGQRALAIFGFSYRSICAPVSGPQSPGGGCLLLSCARRSV